MVLKFWEILARTLLCCQFIHLYCGVGSSHVKCLDRYWVHSNKSSVVGGRSQNLELKFDLGLKGKGGI